MEEDIERKLQGRTLQVYLYLQKKRGPSGIREVQRDLDMSIPSVAEYKVEKLAGMGLVSRDSYGRVVLARRVKVKALEAHVSFGRFSVPRLAFYASIFSAVAVLYAIFDGGSACGVAVPAAAAVLWAEAAKVWKFSVIASKKEKKSVLPLLAPGLTALAVFAAGAVFLLQYVPQQPPPFEEPQQAIQPLESRPTIEESVEMLRQKVAAAGGGWPEFATAMPFGAAAVGAFLADILFRYRSEERGVLLPEQGSETVCGTQDYPERTA